MIIAGHGQIAQMTLPDGWVEGERKEGPGARLARQFEPPESPEVKLCFFYRGGPASEHASGAFARIIKEADHMLSAQEYEELADTVGSISYPGAYDRRSIQTRMLNGKRILVIEGKWTVSNHNSYEIFIDADGSGRFVQQIYYIAPENDYDRYFPAIAKSLDSVQWL